MTAHTPLSETTAIKPPPSVFKPLGQVLLSGVLITAAFLFWPTLLPWVIAACVSYDLLTMATYLAMLTRWAQAVHTLLEQAQANVASRR